jgi:hypothetical protein
VEHTRFLGIDIRGTKPQPGLDEDHGKLTSNPNDGRFPPPA